MERVKVDRNGSSEICLGHHLIPWHQFARVWVSGWEDIEGGYSTPPD
jgi:hypothetical protein